MDLLRIATAGSVDDGKSTLIGRLLYDTGSIPKDKLEALEQGSRRKGLDFTDLSLLTDGLIAEREQGITIDVAYIYFSTPKRKYIIADTPGHVEYTRNMITGASTASVFLILVDARQGITEQTRRHFYIASLLRIAEVAVCINKMDLVDYSEEVYESISKEFREIAGSIGFRGQDIVFIPVAARYGDNIASDSEHMKWFNGPTLLEFLDSIEPLAGLSSRDARLPVQCVVRPHSEDYHDFRGYAGRLTSGTLKKGDEVMVLPGERKSRVSSIFADEEEILMAEAKQSILVTLADDVDVSRGNILVKTSTPPVPRTQLNATICWMSEQLLTEGRMLLLQHGVNRVKAKLTGINGVLDVHSFEMTHDSKEFKMNDIGEVELKLAKPIFADEYADNPANGSFILIDEFTNNTIAAGFVNA